MFFLFLGTTLNAQVTIGSDVIPVSGSLLDLKENDGATTNATKGLLLPRVELEKADELLPSVTTALSPTQKKDYTGLTLYNVATVFAEKICPGIYIWDSKIWQRLYGNCEGFEVSNLKNEYVMDGLEYSFTLKSFNKWTVVFGNTQGAVKAITPLTSGNEGEFEFKFTMAIKTDADASATLTFVNEIGAKEIVTINGKKMTFFTPANIAADVDGYVNNQTSVSFACSSNSTRAIVIKGIPAWAKLTNNTLAISANDGVARNASVTISNGAMTKTVALSQPALVFYTVFNGLAFFKEGSMKFGFLQPGANTNSTKRKISVTTNDPWIMVGLMGNGQPLVGAYPQPLNNNNRVGAVTIKLGTTKSITIPVTQLGSLPYKFRYITDINNDVNVGDSFSIHRGMTGLWVIAPNYDGYPLEYVRTYVTGASKMPIIMGPAISVFGLGVNLSFTNTTAEGTINVVFRLKQLPGNTQTEEYTFVINQTVYTNPNQSGN